MTSIYSNRNGTIVTTSSSNPTKTASSTIRGRTESPSLRTRFQRVTGDPTGQTSSRNPPERISANPIETQRQLQQSRVNSLASSYLQSSTRRFKVEEHDQHNQAKLKQQQAISSSIASTKERLAQKYLGSLKKPVDLEESFGSMRLNGSRGGGDGGAGRPKDQQYNIITHEAIGSSSSGAPGKQRF